MQRTLLLVIVSLFGVAFPADLPEATPEQVGMSSQRLERLSATLRGYIDQNQLPGTVMLIARRGRVVHFEAQGYLDRESETRMRRDAIFRIRSMTKPLTSVAVMLLFEEGHFLFNDPISKFLPYFRDPMVAMEGGSESTQSEPRLVPADREINIRDLLSHTSGLKGAALNRRLRGTRRSAQPIDVDNRELAQLPLKFQPGTKWEYGAGHNVLSSLVEKITGQRYDRFLSERILEPLGMNDTFYYVPDEKLDRLPTAYVRDDSGALRPVGPATEMRGSQVRFPGSTALFSTAEDWAKFCSMLLNGGSYEGGRLISRKTMELMTANHVGDHPLNRYSGGYRFGLGMRVMDDLGRAAVASSPGEYGWSGSYGTHFWIDPQEEMIGILMTQKRPIPADIMLTVQSLGTLAIAD